MIITVGTSTTTTAILALVIQNETYKNDDDDEATTSSTSDDRDGQATGAILSAVTGRRSGRGSSGGVQGIETESVFVGLAHVGDGLTTRRREDVEGDVVAVDLDVGDGASGVLVLEGDGEGVTLNVAVLLMVPVTG